MVRNFLKRFSRFLTMNTSVIDRDWSLLPGIFRAPVYGFMLTADVSSTLIQWPEAPSY